MTEFRPAVGSFVLVPFGARATQVAHVTGYTSTGKVKVRAWNAAQGKWMPNARTMRPEYLKGEARAQHLPAPPRA